MADDTRQSPIQPPSQPKEDLSREALTVDPSAKAFSGTQWRDAKTNEPYSPPDNANAMAGGTQNTAGGQMKEVTIGNAFEGGLKMQDFYDLPKKPCVRDALLTGIGVGFALGGLRMVFRSNVAKASNTVVLGFSAAAGIQYQFCLYRRQQEKEGMMRAVEILNKKEVEKKARADQKERAREQRRRVQEEAQDSKFAALRDKAGGKEGGEGRSSWKFW